MKCQQKSWTGSILTSRQPQIRCARCNEGGNMGGHTTKRASVASLIRLREGLEWTADRENKGPGSCEPGPIPTERVVFSGADLPVGVFLKEAAGSGESIQLGPFGAVVPSDFPEAALQVSIGRPVPVPAGQQFPGVWRPVDPALRKNNLPKTWFFQFGFY